MLFERCHTTNNVGRDLLKQHIKYFNFRSKIQLDHPVLYCEYIVKSHNFLCPQSGIARDDAGDDGAVAVDDRGDGGHHDRDNEDRQRSEGRGMKSITFITQLLTSRGPICLKEVLF